MKNFLNFASKAMALLLTLSLLQCSEEKFDVPVTTTEKSISTGTTATVVPDDPIGCSSCTYVVPANTHVIDGSVLNLAPGSVIGLSDSVEYKNLVFKNIVGTAEKPIIIRNCNGNAVLNGAEFSFTLKTENSKFFRITGGNTYKKYGIKITGGHLGIAVDKLSTSFEIDHVEIENSGFAGIMAKTDPSCDDATIRGNFTMQNVHIHHNYIHDSGGEGMYIGNSFFANGRNLPCGVRLPHEIHYLRVYSNIVKNSGWDGIQVGCATKVARIYGNTIENYGTANVKYQNNGIQIGEGTGGLCYNNLIKSGTGNGMVVLGLGDNVIHNNIIVDAGDYGIFCDERYTPGPGFKFINNSIINPKSDGIRIYAEQVPMNVVINNVISNPGSYWLYSYPRAAKDAFVYKLGESVKIDMSHNFFTTATDSLMLVDIAASNFKSSFGSPLIDNGRDISSYGIQTDFYFKARLKGAAYDIGATEY